MHNGQLTDAELLRAHIRSIAESRCKEKHRDFYEDNQCFGPNAGNHGGPCDSCLDAVRREFEGGPAQITTPAELEAYWAGMAP